MSHRGRLPRPGPEIYFLRPCPAERARSSRPSWAETPEALPPRVAKCEQCILPRHTLFARCAPEAAEFGGIDAPLFKRAGDGWRPPGVDPARAEPVESSLRSCPIIFCQPPENDHGKVCWPFLRILPCRHSSPLVFRPIIGAEVVLNNHTEIRRARNILPGSSGGK